MPIRRPRVALVFDSENAVQPDYVIKSIELARRNGNIVLKTAFGYASLKLRRMYSRCGVKNYSRNGKIHKEKNSSDQRILDYVLEHCEEFDCCVIVSSDVDFAIVFEFLKERGKRVVSHLTQRIQNMSSKLQAMSFTGFLHKRHINAQRLGNLIVAQI